MFRFAAFSSSSPLRRLGLMALACSAVLGLSGCGGGNRAKEYQPDRMVVFGDENSAFATAQLADSYTIKGLVYTINPVVVTEDVIFCKDSAQNINTKCLDSTQIVPASDLTGTPAFTQSSPSSTSAPLGTGIHVPSGSPDQKANVVTYIALGSAATSKQGPLPQLKRTLEVQYRCTASANWVQTVAHAFNLGFRDDPNGCSLDLAGARSFAAVGAHVADLQTQVNNGKYLVGKGALVTVMIGQNDIIDIYENNTLYATLSAKRLEAKYRAEQLAGVIKQLIGSGAKVLVAGVSDLGFSPYGLSKVASTTANCADGVAHASCNGDLQLMVQDFNKTLKIGDKDTGLRGLQDYVYQGRDYGFIDTETIVRSFATSGSYSNLRYCESNTQLDTAMITPAGTKDASTVLNCTSSTAVSGGNTGTYLWADDLLPSWVIHGSIGSTAYNRAANQF